MHVVGTHRHLKMCQLGEACNGLHLHGHMTRLQAHAKTREAGQAGQASQHLPCKQTVVVPGSCMQCMLAVEQQSSVVEAC